MSQGRSVEELLPEVTADRLDTYEALLASLGESRVWAFLHSGEAGDPRARFGAMEVLGHDYVPCVTSEQELAASAWPRAHEIAGGRELAAELFPARWGLWLNPHAPGGGLGVPWPDLRRIALGLDRLPAGPLRISEPAVRAPRFYERLAERARNTPQLRSLRRAWVEPAVGAPYLAIGVETDEPGARTAGAVREMMRGAVAVVPDGLPVATVPLSDVHDPVAMWLRTRSAPFYSRADGREQGVQALRQRGYGYPRPS
ncbi:enhanced serine sensitivity protein SseB C-terminal domain-containing protein [Streptomyces sodiiphilus]|uniref:Enhanced serine sensitivity protein SseB C-terminal domain-containing protein n=1 Tax=Streptomyces sodiiphilus TaxID=226217 RepID=A0ABN2P7M9_9ACTN